MELAGLYWHFVDIVWIFLFPLLYLVDRSHHIVLGPCQDTSLRNRPIYTIFGALMVCTALTVGAAFIDLGNLNFPVALAIAVFKATLVVLFFMHVKYGSRLTKLIVGVRVLLPGDHADADDDRLPVARLVYRAGRLDVCRVDYEHHRFAHDRRAAARADASDHLAEVAPHVLLQSRRNGAVEHLDPLLPL